MLLLELLDGKGVNLRFFVSVFLNFAKGMICNYYKSFVIVVSPLESLIWMKGRDNNLKGKTSYGLKVQQQYVRRRIILIRMTIIVTQKDYVLMQIGFAREHTKCREVLGTFSRN